ncbi:MAG: hypothetical protein KBS79_01830, partial [Lachnospiraceae bacterium]|nr:hypothetical protein [Candidatus Minthocola equi]
VRKSYGIDVLNLAVRNNSYCSVVSQPAISDSIAILTNYNLSLKSGTVIATSAEAGENSIAVDLSLLEGSNGLNQISGGTLVAQSAGVAIKSCHSSLIINGGNVTASAGDCDIRAKAGLNISGKEDFDGGFIGPRLSLTSTSGKVIDASHAILGDSDHPALLENAANEDGLLISSGSGDFTAIPLYAGDEEVPVTISFEDDLVCSYTEKIKLGEGNNVLMTLGGKEAGYFSFRKERNGWIIMQSSKPGMIGMTRTPYLAAKDGKLIYSDEPFVWKYNGSSFYTSEKKLMPARRGLMCLIFGDRYRTVTYYLSTTTADKALSLYPTHAAFYTEHEGEEHVYKANKKGQHVCVNCGRIEDCQYDALTHECICGKYNPDKARIAIDFNYTLNTKKIWRKDVDVYTVSIKTYAIGIDVKKVEYRINGERHWRTGTKVESFYEIKSIEARVLGSNGKWYTASAQEP